MDFRWAFWIFGIICCVAYFFVKSEKRTPKFSKILHGDWIEKNFRKLLFGIVAVFFLLALLEKYSQFYSLQLNANDFWLFVDILEQTKKGGAFLTRFAPQGIGFVQHGSVHPMFTWGLLAPIASLFGSIPVALFFGPLVLTGAGLVLALLARKKWGSLGALAFTFAFFASTQVAKVLHYEVHPEAAYPFFVFLWFWSLGWDGSNRVRWPGLVIAILLGMGIKEDSFLVFGPWIVWGFFSQKGKQRNALILSGMIAACVSVSQLKAVNCWLTHACGPVSWEGLPVTVNVGVEAFHGAHWDSLSGILDLVHSLADPSGGIFGVIKKLLLFWISRPWLSLLIFAPWVLMIRRFWISVLPLTAVYALLEGPNVLWNYYSAPFLGSFWFCATLGPPFKFSNSKKLLLWIIVSTCFLGGNSIHIDFPSQQTLALQEQVKALIPCLGKRGIVSPQFLGWIPQEKVWTERLPRSLDQWNIPDFILVSPNFDRYELKKAEVQEILKHIENDPRWRQIGPGCLPVSPIQKDLSVLLFIK